MSSKKGLLLNPFQQISDKKALLYGAVGLVVTTGLCALNDVHFNGLFQMAIRAENSSFLELLLEHIVIWLVPMLLFYLFGLMLSSSRIRFIDIFGNTLFAQIPFVGVPLISFLPSVRSLMSISEVTPETMQNAYSVTGILLTLLMTLFLVWGAIWMFKAYKISCNLKGVKLGISYALILVCSDLLCRYIIYYLG